MGFSSNWIKWITQCVNTVSYSVLINASPTKPFKPLRGLRQGDPLSPYLFLLCANVLSCALLKQESSHYLKGLKIGRTNQYLSHLLFVDDSFLFFKNEKTSPITIQNTLAWYCRISGQSINLEKSELFCTPNMTQQDKASLANLLSVKLVSNPGKYLGLDFKLRGNIIVDFQDLITKVFTKLQGWKAKLLSQASRMTLINSVLHSIPIYTFSVFKAPYTICKKLDSIVNAFWWGHEPGQKKLYMVNWDTISKPKREGGIGVKKFGLMNKALLANQYWRLCSKPNLLLTKTLKAKYSPQVDLHLHKPKNHSSWIWKSIMQPSTPTLTQGIWKVGRGHDIPVSHPLWFQFKPGAPTLIADQVTRVVDLINQENVTWKTEVITQLYDKNTTKKILGLAIPKIQSQSTKDQIIWPHSNSGDYQVKKAYTLLHQHQKDNHNTPNPTTSSSSKI